MASHEASWISLDRRPGETLRAAIERALRDAVLEGSLRAGARLPSSRRLAAQLGVSRGVTSDAYAQLEAQGFLVVRPRSAPVVAPIRPTRPHPAPVGEAESPPPRFDLTPTTPDVTLFPERQWLAALSHGARRAPLRALDYGDPRGDLGLRETLADHLGRTRGVIADPAQIVIVQGTAQGVDLLLRLLAARGARRVAVEDPSLNRQRQRIEAVGLQAVGRRVDGDGLVVGDGGMGGDDGDGRADGVRPAGGDQPAGGDRPAGGDGVAAGGDDVVTGDLDADAIVVTPAHQFPTGAVLSGERRRALLDWARSRGALVIEDDYDAEFRYDGQPVRALQGLDPELVAYLGTVSKTLAPALRLGWLVAPPRLADDAAHTKRLLDFCSPVLDQLALRHLISTGQYDRHIRRVRALYRARRDRMRAALAKHLPDLEVEGIAAGMHVLVRLPPGVADRRVAAEAERSGVRLEPLSEHELEHRGSPGLVIGYGRMHEDAIEPAIEALAAAIGRVVTQRGPASARA